MFLIESLMYIFMFHSYFDDYLGKITLMKSIANGSVEGFPDHSAVRTAFVEADILGELSHLRCHQCVLGQGLDQLVEGCHRHHGVP